MENSNKLDDFFRQGITGFNAAPSTKVWNGIETSYFGKKRIVVWYYTATAVLMLLAGFIGFQLFYTSSSSNDKAINNNTKPDILVNEELNKQPVNTIINDKFEPAPDNSSKNEANRLSDPAQNSMIITDDGLIESLTENKDRNNTAHTVFNNANESDTEYQYPKGSVNQLYPLSLFNVSELPPTDVQTNYEDIKGMEEFVEKQRNIRFYTGLASQVGMMYYPSTTDQFTWSAELSFGLRLKRFYVESAIEYQDVKERGIYAIDLQSYDSVGFYNEVESFEIDPQTPDQIIYHTKEVTVYDSIAYYKHATPFFKYKYINVPLIVGYHFYEKGSFKAAIEAGIVFSYMIGKDIPSEDYSYPDYTVTRIVNMTPERVEWNLSWRLGIRLNYKLGRSVSVSAMPVFTKSINSVYDTEQGYNNVKPYSMGIKFGLYYGF